MSRGGGDAGSVELQESVECRRRCRQEGV